MLKALLLAMLLTFPATAQELPLPRFASLKSDTVYMRAGPGERFPIEWVYKRAGMPVEITDSFEHWHKIKDIDETSGWVHKKMLSGRRNALTPKNKKLPLYKKERQPSPVIAYFDGQSVLQIIKCPKDNLFCQVRYDDLKGYVVKSELFGVYPDEEIE